jgi:dethiobiotin synthetase
VAAVLAEKLQADYWKPIQAGMADGTDSQWVRSVLSNKQSVVHPELYTLRLPASPHIAAREEGLEIGIGQILEHFERHIRNSRPVVMEGAGGILVPLNNNEFVIDLIRQLNARLILVSRNYLGSINHSLLTAQVCREHKIPVTGWIFNDQYMAYEQEIAGWTGIPFLGSIPKLSGIDREAIRRLGEKISL